MLNPITKVTEWSNWRAPAELFASIANTEKLSDLEHWQKEKLVSDSEKLLMLYGAILWLANLPTAGGAVGKAVLKEQSARLKRAATERDFATSWKGRERPYQWLALWNVHPFARQCINELVDHGRTSVRNFREKVFRPIEVQQNGTRATAVLYDPAELALDGLYDSLWKVITLHPFPFRRCPSCKKIFVITVKKQKFCDKKCANKAVGSRNDYMKDFMVKRRLRTKIAGVKAAIKRLNPKIDTEEIKRLEVKLKGLRLRLEKLGPWRSIKTLPEEGAKAGR